MFKAPFLYFAKKKMTLQALAEQVCRIAIQAGHAIMDIYDHVSDVEVVNKADQSPLTIADQKSNEIICFHLNKLESKYPIISEENKQISYEERKTWTRCWLVDPLDGTKEFIKRNGDFTVNIALVENQAVILGVVYIPVTGACFYGIKNEGAFQFSPTGDHLKLESHAFQSSDSGLKFVCSRSHMSEETQAFVQQYQDPEFIARGSSLKFLTIAQNEAHIYPRLAPTMEWDTAAAQIILEEAGGSVTQQDGSPMRYNKADLLNPFFIAKGNQIN